MSSRVQPAFPCKAVDTAAKLHASAVNNIKTAGYSCAVRYVPHAGSTGALDIDAAELAAILDGGLAIMLVQHVRTPGWDPGQVSGIEDAQRAILAATNAGYAKGAHLFVDLEGIAGTAPATRSFTEDWARTINDAGYRAGVYVGYNVPLTSQQLYLLKGVNSYWSDMGPRHVDTRGFAMKQQATIVINGIQYDPDTIEPDGRGETPNWMVSVDIGVA